MSDMEFPEDGLRLPQTMKIEICGRTLILDPMSENFDATVSEAMKRIRAWATLVRHITHSAPHTETES